MLVFLGIVLLIVGLRGRREGDHPVCRRCGFDLFGKPADATRCSECGNELTRKNAVAVGHPHRKNAELFAGVVLLCAFAGEKAYDASHINWLHYIPAHWVINRASVKDAGVSTPAFAELTDRATNNRLSDANWSELIDTAIAHHADSTKAWQPAWNALLSKARFGRRLHDAQWRKYLVGLAEQVYSLNANRRTAAFDELDAQLADGSPSAEDVREVAEVVLKLQGDSSKAWDCRFGDTIEKLNGTGQLSAGEWKRYVGQAWPGSFGFRLRPQVRRGDPLPYWLDENATRAATNTTLRATVSAIRVQWVGIDMPVISHSNSGSGAKLGGGNAMGFSIDTTEFPVSVTDGIQKVHLTAAVIVGASAADSRIEPTSEGVLDLPGTFTLVPASQSTVTTVKDPSLTDAVRRSISAQVYAGMQSFSLNVNIEAPTPVGLAFDVFIRTGKNETRIGTIACPRGTRDHGYGLSSMKLVVQPGTKVDVILRSNPVAAVGTTNTFEAWDGEITIKDVKAEGP